MIDCDHDFVFEVAEDAADFLAAHGEHLVDGDLRRRAQAILFRRDDFDADQRRVDDLTLHQ